MKEATLFFSMGILVLVDDQIPPKIAVVSNIYLTLHETNSNFAPETGWLEDECFLLGNHVFRGELFVLGRVPAIDKNGSFSPPTWDPKKHRVQGMKHDENEGYSETFGVQESWRDNKLQVYIHGHILDVNDTLASNTH